MEQKVRIRKVFDDGTAQVVHARQSACSGDCHQCGGCAAAGETIVLTAENPIGALEGDLVFIRSDSGPVLKAAAVLYVLPMVLFFLGYLLGAVVWHRGAAAGGVAFAMGIGLAVFYDRKVVRHEHTGYTITGFADQPILKSDRKGDNELD